MEDKETAWTAVKARVAEDLKLYHKVMKCRDTGERVTEPNKGLTEAGLLKEVSSKKPKTERKRPEFTFEDGRFFNFYLERGGRDSDIDNLCVFCQIAGDSTGVLDKDRILYIIKLVERALRESSEICSQWEHKPLRKKLKLYVKWLQSEMSKGVKND